MAKGKKPSVATKIKNVNFDRDRTMTKPKSSVVAGHQKDLARIAATAAGRKAIAEFRASSKGKVANIDKMAIVETKAAKKAAKKTIKSFR